MRIRSVALAAWVACAFASAAFGAPEDFPKPASLEPRVAFWKRVYSEVGTDGGFLHDPDDLSLVYEKVSLPTGRWDRTSQRHVENRKRHVAQVLRNLAHGKRSDLTADEQRILALFPAGAGSRTLRGKAEAVRFQLGQSDKFRAGLARQGRWDAHIRQVFAERGLPSELGALPHVESSFNPEARSSVGASGIWQFMPSTGRLYMRVDASVDERNDPFLATVAAARLLKSNYDAIGSWPLAITGYNHGLGGMHRASRQLGTKDIGVIVERYRSRSFGFASKNFYASFLAALEIDREPELYFGAVRRDAPEDPERVILDHYYRPPVLASAFGVSLDALRTVNPAVTNAVWAGHRLLPKGYELRVPRDPLRAAPRVVLASIPASERVETQVADSAGTHRVRRGETLSRIAAKYGVSTRALQRANGLRSAHRISVGQRLVIPGYSAPAPSPIASAAAAAPPEPAPADRVYRVRRGDTLASIARRFGVSARDLATVNRIANANQIHPGQVIELPGGSLTARPEDRSHAGTYTVRRGDTLDAIARKFGVGVSELIAHNGIRNKNRIKVGQSIYIPGPPEPPATPASEPAPAIAASTPPTEASPTTPAATDLAAAPAPAAAEPQAIATAAASESPADATPVPAALTEPAPAPAPVASAPAEYVVRRGDTLEKISAITGVAQSELIALNRIRNRHRLAVGQTLKLPPPPAPPPSASETAPVESAPAGAGGA
ncbi:MAG TPA: LysM peptidoglycan-binding domain-containing protein [Myxococcota bacterium]|nr:LysM peptidoglycan-binding domain-containing protein [Myxococcota bacterium]